MLVSRWLAPSVSDQGPGCDTIAFPPTRVTRLA